MGRPDRLGLTNTLAQRDRESALQRLKFFDLLPDRCQFALEEVPDVGTGRQTLATRDEKFSNLLKREAKFLGLTDKPQVLDLARAE